MSPYGLPAESPDQHLRREEELRRFLEPDEQVLWHGKPDRRAYVWGQCSVFLFGLLWMALLAAWWTAGMLQSGSAAAFPVGAYVVGSLFALIGFYLTLGNLMLRAREWKHVEYLVTTKRLVVLSGLLTTAPLAKPLNSLNELTLRETALDRKRGIATIMTDRSGSPWGGGTWWKGMVFSFLALRDAPKVIQLIEEARQRCAQRAE